MDWLLKLLSRKDASPAESPGVNKSSVGSIAYDPQIESMQVSCKLHMFTFLEVRKDPFLNYDVYVFRL